MNTSFRFLSAVAAAITLSTPALAQTPPAPDQLPTSGQIVAGQVGVSQTGAAMDITQSTPRAAINWQSFDIGSRAQVNFVQPSNDSVMLNRVVGGNPS
ncbi:MAG: filamentous hemagglutinin N-terminal domain-containing protein [Gammaproteobacteria bacterium]|nr:filamentous hemagglutinin N-terminal domain-containing protein [Gammaproteobacteria bacterium]